MDKIQASFQIMKVSPAFYRIAHSLYFRLGGLLDGPRYLCCLIGNRPYFGPVMLATRTWPIRYPHMRRAIQILIDQKRKEGGEEEFRVLEIGTWAGQSAILWGTELVRSGYPGKVYCIDPWTPFSYGSQNGVNNVTQLMDKVARRDKIFPLFWHNVKSSGLADFILPLRCKSTDILPCFKPNSFDLVFIDGSHTYLQFLNDLTLAIPLVRQSGFICGDDLELQSGEVDLSIAEQNKDKDFIIDPRTQCGYHPGVCLGVSRFFKRKVSVYDGFWITRKNSDHWTDVQLYQSA